MIELHTAPSMYEREIHYNEDKGQKIYLMVNTFKASSTCIPIGEGENCW